MLELVLRSLPSHNLTLISFLGVGIQDVTRDIADSVGLKQAKGAVVTEATKGSPADKAGIMSEAIGVPTTGMAFNKPAIPSALVSGIAAPSRPAMTDLPRCAENGAP